MGVSVGTCISVCGTGGGFGCGVGPCSVSPCGGAVWVCCTSTIGGTIRLESYSQIFYEWQCP
jgi:hypothetical protein